MIGVLYGYLSDKFLLSDDNWGLLLQLVLTLCHLVSYLLLYRQSLILQPHLHLAQLILPLIQLLFLSSRQALQTVDSVQQLLYLFLLCKGDGVLGGGRHWKQIALAHLARIGE